MTQCSAIRKDGKPCTAQAQVGRSCCFFHDPDKGEARNAAQSRGGAKRPTLTAVKPWRGQAGEVTVLKSSPSTEDMVNLLADTIDEVKTGKIDPRIGNTVGYLVGVMLKALEYDALNERIAALEEAVGGRRP